jgi:hypothetical protein
MHISIQDDSNGIYFVFFMNFIVFPMTIQILNELSRNLNRKLILKRIKET